MPVTPFHFGPALVLEGAGPRWFSLSAFAATQVIIDMESVTNILLNRYPVHTHFHTVAGASLIALAVIVVGKRPLTWAKRKVAALLRVPTTPISWTALIAGALFGGLSHIALDAVMHADMTPLAPWRLDNPLLGAVSLATLHLLCVITGIVGLLLIAARRARRSGERPK